jgi:hypothetical protein
VFGKVYCELPLEWFNAFGKLSLLALVTNRRVINLYLPSQLSQEILTFGKV